MSRIQVEYGSAEVTATSDDFTYADGGISTRYSAREVIVAAAQALKAMDTSEADDYISALENGLASRGLPEL